MKAKKIDKEYLLTDDSVNVYGFRLLSSGYLMDKYKANPIGYYMHAPEDAPRTQGVLLRWDDFRVEQDRVYAKPTINLSHPRGERTVSEIENGFLNAASIGKIVVVEFSEDAQLMLPGQTGPTVTKWYNKEISLVDIPGNENALSPLLYDIDGNEINLTDFVRHTLKKQPLANLSGLNLSLNKHKMNFKALLISALALSDTTTDAAIQEHIQDLVDKAAKVSGLEKNLADMKTEKEKALKDLSEFKAQANAGRIKDLIAAGTEAGKLTAKIATDLADKYKDDPEALKNLIDGLPAYQPVTGRIAKEAEAMRDLTDKSWGELDKAGKLQDLKDFDLEAFKAKYKAQFNKEYQ